MSLRVGMVFHGYCDSAFDRNSFGEKRVEAFGADWIVARDENGRVLFAEVRESEFDENVERWSAKDAE